MRVTKQERDLSQRNDILPGLRLPILIAPVLIAACSAGSGQMGADDVVSAIDGYCSDCHNPVDFSGNLSFDQLDPAQVGADATCGTGTDSSPRHHRAAPGACTVGVGTRAPQPGAGGSAAASRAAVGACARA